MGRATGLSVSTGASRSADTGCVETAVWLCFAGALGLGAAAVAGRSLQLVRRGNRTRGVVVAWERDDDCYHPVIEYRLPDGRTRRFRSETGWGWRVWQEGRGVPVVYDPDDASRAEIDRFLVHWLAPIAIALLALVFAVAAVWGGP